MTDPSRAERSRVPDDLLEMLSGEVASIVGAPEILLELWSDQGQMLPRAIELLRPERAVALFSDGDAITARHRSVPGLTVGVMAESFPPAQAVLGILPWRWAPRPVTVRTPDGEVHLNDDPASVTLLHACLAMPPEGVTAAIVGPGFVARRGTGSVAANLKRLGLCTVRAITLDRGLFRPTSGRGRILLLLRRDA